MTRIFITVIAVLLSVQAYATTSTAVFYDGATDYQKFMLSNPNVKVISVTATRVQKNDLAQMDDSTDEMLVRRISTRSGLVVVYEN